MTNDEVRETALLAFIWGAIFAVGLWAAMQYVLTWLSWHDPPTLANLIVTEVFAALAVILLVPSLFVFWKVIQGQFAALVEASR